MSPPEIVRGAGGFCRRLVNSRGTCAHYDLRQVSYDTCRVGHRRFSCSLGNVARRCPPVVTSTHWACGLLDAAVQLGFWAKVRTNCARCAASEEPIFPKRLTSTSGLKEDGIVLGSQTCRQDTTFTMQLCTHHAPFSHVRHEGGSRRLKNVIF